jgi:hypothetical protein
VHDCESKSESKCEHNSKGKQEVCKKKVLYIGLNFQAKAFRPPPPQIEFLPQMGHSSMLYSQIKQVVWGKYLGGSREQRKGFGEQKRCFGKPVGHSS